MTADRTALPLARTSAEAHLYMELHPCDTCGESEFEPDSALVEADGHLAGRYTGACPFCGTTREFTFRLPDEVILPDDDDPHFGGDEPSQLIDAGEWWWLGDVMAGDVPADPAGLDGRDRRFARTDLLTAAAALTEVLKFLPPGADAVPVTAFWSDRGREVRAAGSGRFRRQRLEAVRDTYRDLAARFA